MPIKTNFLARFWPSIETNTRSELSRTSRRVAVVDAAVMAEAASKEADKAADEDRGWNKLAVTFQASPDAMLVPTSLLQIALLHLRDD